MRKKIVAGNWKMNKTFQEAEELISSVADRLVNEEINCEVVICPPALYLEMASDYAEESILQIAAQNVSGFENGAYTGEISASMLAEMEIAYCIVGHSERRKFFKETDDQLAEKVDRLLDYNVRPIFCVGEQLEEREVGSQFDVVRSQMVNGLFHLNKEEFSNIVVAYEPVWAIGTGIVATPDQAQEMHNFIRKLISEKYNPQIADATTILYGGSCNADNSTTLFSKKDVDGGLIGGASLKADEFVKIVMSVK
ncbi:MAG: triose-phosphate isomerase [Bacteroidetes bacterium]|nr:triose-phosphate isomerase [Bacteroidota bacterium]|tara:strand:- start:1153 stop:1911 length:759 start_codon:yes stop_codon:yes gene_type:complete